LPDDRYVGRLVWQTGDLVFNQKGGADKPLGWRAARRGGWGGGRFWNGGRTWQPGTAVPSPGSIALGEALEALNATGAAGLGLRDRDRPLPLASVPDQAVGTKEGGRPPDFLTRRDEMIGLLTLENVRRYMPHHPRGFHMGDSRTAPIDRAAV
jgi:hypothetical protein